MRKLDRLIREARQAAEWRGHRIGRFIHYKTREWARSECSLCGRTVLINADPLPNSIEIGGEAVAVNCGD